MGLVIEDGKGTGNKAEVNAEQELVVRAITESELEHASILGNAYSWDSTELDIDAGDSMLYLRNDSDTPLVLDNICINGSNVICTWEIGLGTATTTPSGTTVTGVNLSTADASKTANATALSDETAVADASIVGRIKTPIDNTVVFDATGIILAKNHYIQINQETESTSGSAVITGHYTNPS